MALSPYQGKVPRSMLGTELTVITVDYLGIIVVTLSVYLMRKVLLVNRRICGDFGVALKGFYVLIMSRSNNGFLRILRRNVVVLVTFSRSDGAALVLVY